MKITIAERLEDFDGDTARAMNDVWAEFMRQALKEGWQRIFWATVRWSFERGPQGRRIQLEVDVQP